MESVFVREIGQRGPGRPVDSTMVLPGVGDRNQRTRAARRAVEVLKNRDREVYERLFESELRYILAQEQGEV